MYLHVMISADAHLMHHLARGVNLLPGDHLHCPGLARLHHLEPGGGLLTQALLDYLGNKLSAALQVTEGPDRSENRSLHQCSTLRLS